MDEIGHPEDATVVRQLYLAAVAAQHDAAYELAIMYISCRILVRYPYSCPDNEPAAEVLTDPANRGYAPAQSLLGEMYLFGGNGVSVDYRSAMRLFTAAATKNDSAAYYWLVRFISSAWGSIPTRK